MANKQSYKYLKDTMSLKKLYEMCPGYTQNFKYTMVHIIIPYNFFRSVKKCLCQLNLFYCAWKVSNEYEFSENNIYSIITHQVFSVNFQIMHYFNEVREPVDQLFKLKKL